MKTLIIALCALWITSISAATSHPRIISLSHDDLKIDAPIENPDKYITISNSGGVNVLQNYPVRPEYSFEGGEMIYALPRMDGNYLIYIDEDSRIPDLEVDIFILTDPNDEKSAKMWMNGTGAKQLLQAKPYEQYYAVVDGFKGVTARLSIAVAELTAMATFCSNDNQTIDLNDFLTGVTTVPGDVWSQLTGTGGSLNTTTGIFTSAPGTTTSSFRLIRDCGPTEDVFIGFQDCIPTLNQWGLIIFSILLLITGVLAIRWQSAT